MFIRYLSIFIVGLAASAPASAANYTVTVLQEVGADLSGPGIDGTGALGINDSGQIVGWSDRSSSEYAALWSSTGAGMTLQNVGGFSMGHSVATGINASGQIVGYSQRANGGGYEAALWSSGGAGTTLQDIGGSDYSMALGINASGQIVGTSMASMNFEAVLWSSTGDVTALDSPGWSEAYGINDSGQIVGWSLAASGSREAVLWASTGVGTDLASILGGDWTSSTATAINDQGDIVGGGNYMGSSAGFLLTPSTVPEPSTWAMTLVGFAGLGFAGSLT